MPFLFQFSSRSRSRFLYFKPDTQIHVMVKNPAKATGRATGLRLSDNVNFPDQFNNVYKITGP